jgi:ribosomal-protein-alanine N-acetyltransferase
MTYIIRYAHSSDLHTLVKLEDTCFNTDKISKRSFQRFLKTNSTVILVIEKEGLVIGAATLLRRANSKQIRLYSLAIQKEYRGQGVAAELDIAIEKWAKEHSYHDIVLEARPDNTVAIKFYQKHGYKLFGRYIDFYEDGSDALRMKKHICLEKQLLPIK